MQHHVEFESVRDAGSQWRFQGSIPYLLVCARGPQYIISFWKSIVALLTTECVHNAQGGTVCKPKT